MLLVKYCELFGVVTLNYSRESSTNADTKANADSKANVDIHYSRCLPISSTQFYSRYSKSPVLRRIFWLESLAGVRVGCLLYTTNL
jgi:hypothetical protein